MTSRREKIEALLASPSEGERTAAQAALGRIAEEIPRTGTPQYVAALQAWNGDIDWAVSRLGTPSLTIDEIRTIRNLSKYRGSPWARGSDAFRAVFQKLQNLEKSKANVAIPFVYTKTL